MTELPAVPPTNYREQVALLRNAKGLLKLLGYYALASFLTLILLGFAFMMILFPLTLIFIRLSIIYTPAYHLAGRIMGVQGLPERLAGPPTWLIVSSTVQTLFHLAIIAMIVRAFFFIGFCTQNPVCMLGSLLLKHRLP